MKVSRILLTGDDGYNSIGTRLLARVLKKNYDLAIIGTRDQQSGVGGHLSLKTGGTWGEDTVEGVKAMWVSGYPCDAVECAVGYFKNPFDLIVSGINWGMNIGGSLISSGTYSAASRSLHLGFAKKAIVTSWFLPPSYWLTRHDGLEQIEEYMAYPGKTAEKIIQNAIQNDLWGAGLININFPAEPSNKARFVKGIPDLRQFFSYPIPMDNTNHTYHYQRGGMSGETKGKLEYDTGALLSGYITIALHVVSLDDPELYEKNKTKRITLR